LKRKIAITLALVALASIGFGVYKQVNTKKQVQETVKGYNSTLVQAMRRPQPELMKRWTTPKELERVTMYILFLYSKNKIIDAKLKSLKFSKVTVSGKTAKVFTDEVWEDRYLDAKTGQEVGNRENYHYQGTYSLEKTESGNWVVSELNVKEL